MEQDSLSATEVIPSNEGQAEAEMQEAFEREIDGLIQTIQHVPCGKPRSKRTLYQEMESIPMPPENIRVVIRSLISYSTQIRYVKELVTSLGEARSYREPAPDLFLTLIYELGTKHHKLFGLMIQILGETWRQRFSAAFRAEIARRHSNRHLQQHKIHLEQQLKKEREAPGDTKAVPKTELNRAIYAICSVFRSYTGKPHHGLVGQLFFHARIEDASGLATNVRWEALRKRVAIREKRFKLHRSKTNK